jgi:glycine cleavage system aminomethyltransferase T
MLLTSPSMKQQLSARLDKVIFPADDVTVTDVSDKCRMLTVLGPQADDVMQQLAGVSRVSGFSFNGVKQAACGHGVSVVVVVGGGVRAVVGCARTISRIDWTGVCSTSVSTQHTCHTSI